MLVTGATGGVAMVAIALLARLGIPAVALTRKEERVRGRLRQLGAQEVLDPQELEPSDKPLLKERWAAVVDTIGGPLLEHLLKATCAGGTVAACGMAAGNRFASTVLPLHPARRGPGRHRLGRDPLGQARADLEPPGHGLEGGPGAHQFRSGPGRHRRLRAGTAGGDPRGAHGGEDRVAEPPRILTPAIRAGEGGDSSCNRRNVHPAMSPAYDQGSGSDPGLIPDGLGFLAPGMKVGRETEVPGQVSDFIQRMDSEIRFNLFTK